MPRSLRPASRVSVTLSTHPVSLSLSPWESDGVRARSVVSVPPAGRGPRAGSQRGVDVAGGFSSPGAVSPHPDPLPGEEGMLGNVLRQSRLNLRPLASDLCSGRVRLTSLLALSSLLLALFALPFIARTRSASTAGISSAASHALPPYPPPLTPGLSWLSEHAWMSPPADANSTDLRPLISDLWSSTIFASRTALTLSPVSPPIPANPLLFWRTDGTSGTWTLSNWSNPASATGGTAWTSGDDAEFSANSTVTFASTAVGNITVDDGRTVTVTQVGTLSTGTHVFTIGTGSTLTWTGQ